jgi:hypothetical protein
MNYQQNSEVAEETILVLGECLKRVGMLAGE